MHNAYVEILYCSCHNNSKYMHIVCTFIYIFWVIGGGVKCYISRLCAIFAICIFQASEQGIILLQ